MERVGRHRPGPAVEHILKHERCQHADQINQLFLVQSDDGTVYIAKLVHTYSQCVGSVLLIAGKVSVMKGIAHLIQSFRISFGLAAL